MSPYTELAHTVTRIATATSVARTRAEYAERVERHNGTHSEIERAVGSAVKQLKSVADELESALA